MVEVNPSECYCNMQLLTDNVLSLSAVQNKLDAVCALACEILNTEEGIM